MSILLAGGPTWIGEQSSAEAAWNLIATNGIPSGTGAPVVIGLLRLVHQILF
jgi:hypothetical protein